MSVPMIVGGQQPGGFGVSPFRATQDGCLSTSATRVVAVTPSDVTTYDPPLRGVRVLTSGNLAFTDSAGTNSSVWAVTAGETIAVEMTKVRSTGTTCTVEGLR